MNQQEALEWATRQDVVKVRTIKVDGEDKFTYVVGEYVVSPLLFDSQEEAEEYLQGSLMLDNLNLAIIGAMCQKLNNIYKQQKQ